MKSSSFRDALQSAKPAGVQARNLDMMNIPGFRVRSQLTLRAPRNDRSELDLRHRLDFLAGLAEIEEVLVGEAEGAGK